MQADTPLTALKGVGDAVAAKLAKLGLVTVDDLINNVPRRYDDYSHLLTTGQLRPGMVSIHAKITSVSGRYVRRGMHITEAIAQDNAGSVRLIWFNQPYRAESLRPGADYYISGEFKLQRQRFSILNPSVELVTDFPLNTARIIPIYRETKGVTSRQIRQYLVQVVPYMNELPESLPERIVSEYGLLPYREAIRALHFPRNADELEQARYRLGFEEVFELIMASLLNKQENSYERARKVRFDEKVAQRFVSHLPFQLTDGQRRAIWQAYLDMGRDAPMNRLVEGDVGSGKTVVATMAALMAMHDGWQVAFMAPTELLARQHADTVYNLLEPLGLADHVSLLVGSLTVAQKRHAREAIAAGRTRLIIGTHALIQDSVDMHKLALVIIDEQHRFGVEQRKKLMAKAGVMPHVLSLTATPIPRTLALTLYGELDISVLESKPAGRQPIQTQLVSPNSREPVYDTVRNQLQQGRQVFVVCPLIKESEVMDAASVEHVYEDLRTGPFKAWRVGLLHGKLSADEKQRIMADFVAHRLDILVATTVIEVGVDVPNASVMMIEAPERFGLAQLHQLRGRIGRGGHEGYCLLMLSDSKAPSPRLRALESSNDGFRLAELDLEIRGPGAIYGTVQHGALDLRIASLTDTALIAAARSAAQTVLQTGIDLVQYPQVMQHINRLRAVTNLN